MNTVEEAKAFQKILLETGSYRTDPHRPVSALGRSDIWYYLRLLKFLWDGSRLVAQGKYSDPVWAAHSMTYLSIVEDCGGVFDISGFEHSVRLGRSCVYIGNHMSLLEAFVTPSIFLSLNRPAAVAKKSLLNYPLLGPITRAVDPIAVGRTNPREDLKSVLEQGKACLDNNRSVVLFPQATRSATFNPKAFNSLGVKLAKRAGAPIIPLALKTDFIQNGKLIKDLGSLDRTKTIHMKFGEPLRVEENEKDANLKIISFIQESLEEWSS